MYQLTHIIFLSLAIILCVCVCASSSIRQYVTVSFNPFAIIAHRTPRTLLLQPPLPRLPMPSTAKNWSKPNSERCWNSCLQDRPHSRSSTGKTEWCANDMRGLWERNWHGRKEMKKFVAIVRVCVCVCLRWALFFRVSGRSFRTQLYYENYRCKHVNIYNTINVFVVIVHTPDMVHLRQKNIITTTATTATTE